MDGDVEAFKKALNDVTASCDEESNEAQCHQKIWKFLQMIHTTATNTDRKIAQNVSQMLLSFYLLQV